MTTTTQWELVPCEASSRNTGRKSERPTATMSKTGVLSLNQATMSLLGKPDYLLVYVDHDRLSLRIQASEDTSPAYTVSGEHSRIALKKLIRTNRMLIGNYSVTPDGDNTIILRRTSRH